MHVLTYRKQHPNYCQLFSNCNMITTVHLESIIFLAASAYLNNSFLASSLYLMRESLEFPKKEPWVILSPSTELSLCMYSEVRDWIWTWWGCHSWPLWTWRERWRAHTRWAAGGPLLYQSPSSPTASGWMTPGAAQSLQCANQQLPINPWEIYASLDAFSQFTTFF